MQKMQEEDFMLVDIVGVCSRSSTYTVENN